MSELQEDLSLSPAGTVDDDQMEVASREEIKEQTVAERSPASTDNGLFNQMGVETMREAILLIEILSPPKALREENFF